MHHEGREPLALVADGDSSVRRLARESLKERGFAVKTVENGELAVAMFRHLNPAIVILDADMPGMNGHIGINQEESRRKTCTRHSAPRQKRCEIYSHRL